MEVPKAHTHMQYFTKSASFPLLNDGVRLFPQIICGDFTKDILAIVTLLMVTISDHTIKKKRSMHKSASFSLL